MRKSKHPINIAECRYLTNVLCGVHKNIVEYMYRNNGDDFMLRVELLGLQKKLEEIRERYKEEYIND